MERELKEMVTDADMERLQAVAEPLTDMFDEIEGDGSECYITWNFGYNKYGEITCGFDVRMHPRYEDDEQKVEEIKARIDDALELCGFELDSDIKHANPSENIFGGWHYQIKKIDDTDTDVELTTDDMNAGQWYESLDKDEWDGFFSHNRDLDECDEEFDESLGEEATSNKKFIIKYGKGRPGGDSEVVEFPSFREAERYAADHARGWGFEVTPFDESLSEDTIKTKDGKWTNKGKEGTHGKFKTKKAADAQRKAMFANGFHESVVGGELLRTLPDGYWDRPYTSTKDYHHKWVGKEIRVTDSYYGNYVIIDVDDDKYIDCVPTNDLKNKRVNGSNRLKIEDRDDTWQFTGKTFDVKGFDECLSEDTEKIKDGKWTNKGDEGTHGKFKTKKAADAQRKAMFANGFKESLGEDLGDLFRRIHDEDEHNWNLHNCDYTEFYDELKQYMEPGETWDAVDDMGWNADTNVDPVDLFRRMPKDKQIDFMNRFYIREDFSRPFSDYDLED